VGVERKNSSLTRATDGITIPPHRGECANRWLLLLNRVAVPGILGLFVACDDARRVRRYEDELFPSIVFDPTASGVILRGFAGFLFGRLSLRSLRLTAVLIASLSTAAFGADPAGVQFFEAKIRPVLIKHCYECHSADSKSLKGGLLVDTADGLKKGGDSGPSVYPGKPEDSVLLQAIQYENYEMPPSGKLPDDVIKDFERWISMGAPDPRTEAGGRPAAKAGIDIDAGKAFWAFQPVEPHVTPPVKDEAWPRTWIDRYVLSQLEAKGLKPQPPADRATLLRRISYDLVGLPPTEEALSSLLENDDPQALEAYVDDLMRSPQFGEHWGRHWLDVARYADSNGGDFNATFHDAWRYRNYIIDAYNADRPFHELIVEQIAGDLLPASNDADRERQLVATGFLMLGAKMLSERDKEKLRMDVVDEQVSSVGGAFLGMTLGCARCHDHKFDPIPTRDYYALAGIFRSTQVLDGEIQKYVSNWVKQPLPIDPQHAVALKEHQEKSKDLTARIKAAEEEVKKQKASDSLSSSLDQGIVVDNEEAEVVGQWKASVLSKQFVGKGYIHDDKQDKGQKQVTFRKNLPADGEYEVRIAYPGSNGRATNVPVTIVHAAGETTVSVDQSQVAPLEKLLKPIGRFEFNADKQAEVTISNAGTEGYVIVDAVQFVPVKDLDAVAKKKPSDDPKAVELARQAQKELDRLKQEQKDLTAAAPKLAPVAFAVNDAPQKGDCNICIRGETNMLGPKVPRGFLQVAMFDEPPAIAPDESGRLALARWVADSRNPLTARVYVNRVWHYLMGAGLVRSVDNFGMLGERPTHPELLDQLAVEFVAHNWSTKQLVRRIVLSQVYQLSSGYDETSWNADPENKLLWRANRKRVPAEAIRDSMLAAGDALDARPTASPVAGLGTLVTVNRPDDAGYSQKEANVRTVYAPVIRTELPSLLRVFDFADPDFVTGQRSETNVPAQALWMLNGEFVVAQSSRVVDRALKVELSTVGERVEQLYRLTLGRPPTPQEAMIAQKYVDEKGLESLTDDKAKVVWKDLVHAIFASSSFRMVD
jgi:hypothetical protein